MAAYKTYDLIIVGSGAVGSASGYYAAKAGLKVLMIDSYTPPHNNGSHHGSTRLLRHAYEEEKYVPMLLRARKLWDELAEITTKDIINPCGVISIGRKDSAFIKKCSDSAVKFNLKATNLTAKEIEDKWPGIKVPSDYYGLYELDAGFLRSELAVENLIRLSKEHGAEQLFNCEVVSIKNRDGIIEVSTKSGSFQGIKVAITSGTWVKALIPNLPVTPLRKVVSWHEADDRYASNFPGFVIVDDDDIFYGFPKDSIGVKVGKHTKGQVIERCDQVTPFGSHENDAIENEMMLAKFLPGVKRLVTGITCTYDMSPDEDFIIDKLPNAENIFVVTGLSGHGYKFATVLGEIVALYAQNKAPQFDITPFSLKRFA